MTKLSESILADVKKQGKKITKTRKAIIEMLCNTHSLKTAIEIKDALRDQDIVLNKTSVYRELSFLVAHNIINEVVIQPGIVHYESALHPHHHHLICTECGDTKEIQTQEFDEPMQLIVKKAHKNGFIIKDHSFEFFGICKQCK